MLLGLPSTLTVSLLQKRKKDLPDTEEGEKLNRYQPRGRPLWTSPASHAGARQTHLGIPLTFSKRMAQGHAWGTWLVSDLLSFTSWALTGRSRTCGPLARFREDAQILPPAPTSCSMKTVTVGVDARLAFDARSQLMRNSSACSLLRTLRSPMCMRCLSPFGGISVAWRQEH